MDVLLLYGLPMMIIILVLYWFGVRHLLRYFSLKKTQAITNNLFCLKPGFSQAYVFQEQDTLLCFDAGSLDPDQLAQEFEKVDLDPSKVEHVFLTHIDSDHVKGLGLFNDPIIYVNKQEMNVDPQKTRFFRKGRKISEDKDIELVNDGQEISIGDSNITVVALPGHTQGSVAFVINNTILITGDAVNIHQNKISTAPWFINDDSKLAQQSLQKLKDFNKVEIICTGHSGFIDQNAQKSLQNL